MYNEKIQEEIQSTCNYILSIVDSLGVKISGKEPEFAAERFMLTVHILSFALGGYVQSCVKDKEAQEVIFKRICDDMTSVRIKKDDDS